MKKVLFFASLTLILGACNTGETPVNTNNTGPIPDSTKTRLTAEQWEERAKKNPKIAETDNKTSPFRYAQTNAELNIFGSLIGGSDYAKKLHNEDFVLLCPSNEVMNKLDNGTLVALKDPSNKVALNQFIAAHILKPPFSIEKLDLIGQATTIYDQLYMIDPVSRTINGAKLGTYEITCQIGKIVEMKGLIVNPRFDKPTEKKKTK